MNTLDGVWFVVAALIMTPVLWRIAESLEKIAKNTTPEITSGDRTVEVTMHSGEKFNIKP